MISPSYAAALTMPDEVRHWLEQHAMSTAWMHLLTKGQKVIAQYTFTFWETWCDDPDEWGVKFSDVYDTVKAGEVGEIIIPHPKDFCVWLVKFDKRRHWWIRWEPDRATHSAAYWSIVPQFAQPPDNDPTRYERRLL